MLIAYDEEAIPALSAHAHHSSAVQNKHATQGQTRGGAGQATQEHAKKERNGNNL